MRSFKNILFVLAAFAWLPMTAHCQLESIPGFEFLACVTESSCHGKPNPQESTPEDGGCCAVEKAHYKTELMRVTLPLPALQPMESGALRDGANTLPAKASLGMLTAAPPDLPSSWQFSRRTALPARAPSFVS